MKKIAIVNQRYGNDVNGGSEAYARKLAEHMRKYYKVDVLTTNALEYETWQPNFEAGVSECNGVTIRRFRVAK